LYYVSDAQRLAVALIRPWSVEDTSGEAGLSCGVSKYVPRCCCEVRRDAEGVEAVLQEMPNLVDLVIFYFWRWLFTLLGGG
jgi:hypothetical protein